MSITIALPPPSNLLDARQRTRLMRSTRKLGAVLGTTPRLIEDDVPFIPALVCSRSALTPEEKRCIHRTRRQGSVFTYPPPAANFYDGTSSASSSATSLASSLASAPTPAPFFPPPKSFATHRREYSASSKRKAPLPTPLVLRLNAVPLPPSDPRVQVPRTPESASLLSTSTTSLPRTPLTPASPVATVTETRRKRLAKLQRTLGENVPPELVFPFKTIRKTVLSPITSPAETQPAQPARSNRLPTPPDSLHTTPATSPNSHPPSPTKRRAARRRSVSVDFKVGVSSSSPRWVTGTSNWRGEWNRRDIREVQQQLRKLK